MTDDTLLPCPFCGRTPTKINFQRKYDFDFAIECECGACMSQCEYAGGPGQESKEKTIQQWNSRAHQPVDGAMTLTLEQVECLKEYLRQLGVPEPDRSGWHIPAGHLATWTMDAISMYRKKAIQAMQEKG